MHCPQTFSHCKCLLQSCSTLGRDMQSALKKIHSQLTSPSLLTAICALNVKQQYKVLL